MSRTSLALGLALLLLAGCATPGSNPGTSGPGISSGAAAPEEGTPFDPELWDEPVPPRADKITANVGGEWKLHVVGQAGAVSRAGQVLIADIGVGRGALVASAADGSFSGDITGGPGATVQVALFPERFPPAPSFNLQLSAFQHMLPSAYVRVPDPGAPSPEGGAHVVSATGRTLGYLPWSVSGSAKDDGANMEFHGALRLKSERDRAAFLYSARLVRSFDASGEPMPQGGEFSSAYQTPSGFGLNRLTLQANPTATTVQRCDAQRASPMTLTCPVDVVVRAADVPPGGYSLHLWVDTDPVFPDELRGEESVPADGLISGARQYDNGALGSWGAMTPLAVQGIPLAFFVRGGVAPRMATLLFVDSPSQGVRGLVPDNEYWGWGNHIVWQPYLYVTPRVDQAGAPIRYLFEPYLPQLMVTDRESPAPPPFWPALPGGTWTVTITDPTSASMTLGPAPFQELVSRAASEKGDMPLNQGGDQVTGVARLATLDERFRHAFARDGLHRVQVEGQFPDTEGHTFRIASTFSILVAEPLDLDLGMLPGTPIAIGQSVDRSVQTHPPVAAQIAYRFREWTGPDAALTTDITTRGAASRYGWFHPHPGQPVTPTQPGEYRVDVAANYTDASGRLWAATWSVGGVVVDPGHALEVHGRRGDDTAHQDLARYRRSQTGLASNTGSHLNLPYYGGDVAWQTDDDAMYVRLTLADRSGSVAALFNARAANVTDLDPVGVDGMGGQGPADGADSVAPRFAAGQGPMFSSTAAGIDPAFGPALDRFGYFSAAVERPGVRVRESWREDNLHRAYWRFSQDTYTLQPNMGPEGDAPNDYKFLFGGAVVRAPDQGFLGTGGYASLWVDLSSKDPIGSRIDSPFNPDATAILSPNGHSVRAFFDPTGTRAGSLLEVGDMADFGGYVVPLGPQHLIVDVTSPSGKVRHLEGTANDWGHLHDASMNFEVDEPGVWLVKVQLHACPPARDASFPCQDGGLNDGSDTYDFYVASKDHAIAGIRTPAFMPAGKPLVLTLPQGAAGAHQTSWMPGWLLDDRDIEAGQPIVSYDPRALAAKFPNFAANGFQQGVPAAQVTFTVVAPQPDGSWAGFAFDTWAGRVLSVG